MSHQPPAFPQPGYPGSAPTGQPGYPAAHHGSTYPGQQAPSPSYHGQGFAAPPAAQQQQQGGAQSIDTSGTYEGVQYHIAYRDSNSMLSVRLSPGIELKAKPGSMVAMDPTVQIKGKMKLSFKKMLTGGEMSESIFTGPGEVLLAPETWGDVVPIVLDGSTPWYFSKHAFLASTAQVVHTHKSQSAGKALFSGEGLFVSQATGRGVVFVQSLGAIIQRQLKPGDTWIVDNGHLVAWTAKYNVQRIDAGGFLSKAHTDEGLICKFTGPGTVYIQTRNPETLIDWIKEQLPNN